MIEGVEGISKGDLFLALETRKYNHSEDIIFQEGKIYQSYSDGHIKDETGNAYHSFTYNYWTKHLIKIGNSGNYNNTIAQKLNIARLLKKHGYKYNLKTNEIVKIK